MPTQTITYKGVTLEVDYDLEEVTPATHDQPAEGGEMTINSITTMDCIADLLSNEDEKSIEQLITERL